MKKRSGGGNKLKAAKAALRDVRARLSGRARGIPVGRARGQGRQEGLRLPGHGGRRRARPVGEAAGRAADGAAAAVREADRVRPGQERMGVRALRRVGRSAARRCCASGSTRATGRSRPRRWSRSCRRPARSGAETRSSHWSSGVGAEAVRGRQVDCPRSVTAARPAAAAVGGLEPEGVAAIDAVDRADHRRDAAHDLQEIVVGLRQDVGGRDRRARPTHREVRRRTRAGRRRRRGPNRGRPPSGTRGSSPRRPRRPSGCART